MLTRSKLSYQRLRQEVSLLEDEIEEKDEKRSVVQQRPPSRNFFSVTGAATTTATGLQLPPPPRQTKVHLKNRSSSSRRWRLRVSGLRKFFFFKRRKPSVRVIWAKVVKRLKESQAHFGDLFAGNYLFFQVAPDYPFSNSKNKPTASYLSSSSHHNIMMRNQKKLPDFPHSLPPLYLSSSRVLTFN